MRQTVIALMLFVSGAAAVAQPAKQNPSAPPQKGHCDVGVVSNLGEKFRVEKAGFPEPNVTEVSVESWHLDDFVVAKIRGALGNRAAVQRIPYRKEALAAIEALDNNHVRSAPLFRWFRYSDDVAKFRDAIRTLASGTRCARYVLVTKAIVDDGDHSYREGIRIFKGLLDHGMVEAVIAVRVFDGEGKVLSTRRADYSKQSFPGIFGTAHPERLLDESSWPDPPNSAAQNAKLREAARELIARCLDAALPKPLP